MIKANSISRLCTMLRQGQISPTELCEESVNHAAKYKHLNMMISSTSDLALQQARNCEQSMGRNKGTNALFSIPVAYKDNFCTKGIQTSCASKMLKGFVPTYNATVVDRLEKAGALTVGKANMDEFAMGCGSIDTCFGPVRNPWSYKDDNWHVSGGSSGGSAVAVATGVASVALGSDTGGSARNPASYCGVVALKPTYGLLSRHGLIPLVNSLDCPSVITKTVDDCALAFNALLGRDPLDSTSIGHFKQDLIVPDKPSVKGLTIGIPQEYNTHGLSRDTYALWCKVADMFCDAGANVISVSLPHTLYSLICYSVICATEVASNMARYDGIQYGHRSDDEKSSDALYAATRHNGFNEVVRGRILAGNYFLLKKNYNKHFIQALKVRRLIRDDFTSVFRKQSVDLLLAPTVLGDAPKYKDFSNADNRTRTMEQDVYTQAANMAGIPGLVVPCGFSHNQLPIGLQLLGDSFQEEKLLSVGKWLEQQVNFPCHDVSLIDFE